MSKPDERTSGWVQGALERIARGGSMPTRPPVNDDQEPITGPNNVQSMMPSDKLEEKIREYNNKLVTIETQVDQLFQEHEKTRLKMVRLQEQYDGRFREHMMGWAVKTELLNPLKVGRPPAIKVEPVQE
jgi:hypothetical protein